MPPPALTYLDHPILQPQPGVPWADTMLLNPTVAADPRSDRLHLLFRATGPWPQARARGRPLPFPIFLGYAWSDDDGETWEADFGRPCLAPALEQAPDEIFIRNRDGRDVINYANGCIEDPRFFWLENQLYLTTACRMFPPGPYWEHDEPTQCAPAWTREADHGLGRAARENLTVTVLWAVDLAALRSRNYSDAFQYVTHLTDPERADNRDVFLFPKRGFNGDASRLLLLHRPFSSRAFGEPFADLPPSIFLASASRFADFPTNAARHALLAAPLFPWEKNRIGASWTPIALGDDEWLLPYHGKQDSAVGYTQSFAILREDAAAGMKIVHRCSERVMFARQPWELGGRFKTPCLFTCGGVRRGADLLMTYGAADAVAGVARVNFSELISYLRTFDEHGRRHG